MPKIIVAGGITMDATITVDRHPRPGEEIPGRELCYTPGGKGLNQAVAASRAGGSVFMIGCVGQDAFGEQLIRFLDAEHVNVDNVQMDIGKYTKLAFIVVNSAGENTIIYDAQRLMEPSLEGIATLIESGDILLAQTAFRPDIITDFFQLGRLKGSRNIFNIAPVRPVDPKAIKSSDIIIVNEFELAELTGSASVDSSDRSTVEGAISTLIGSSNKTVVVTLGAKGCVVFENEIATWIDGIPSRVVDTTGAGDAFLGALSAALAAGNPIRSAARYANASASVAITRKGCATAMPTRSEVEAELRSRTIS